MKRILFFCIFTFCAITGLAQTPEPSPQAANRGILNLPELTSAPSLFTQALPVRVREIDGSPNISAISVMRVPNNSMSCTGSDCTFTWAVTAGTGDVVGPASATDNAVARFDLTTGKLIQNSGVIIDDSNNVSGVGTLASGTHTIATGQFGLGATETNSAMNLQGANSSAFGYRMRMQNTYSGAGDNYVSFTMFNHNSSIVNQFYIDTNGTGALGRAGVYFGTFTASDVAFFRGNTERFSINSASLRVSNGTSAGNLIVGTSAGAIGTSGAGVLAFTLSTAPTTSPTDTVQQFSGDAAAGAHELYTRNETGGIERQTGLCARNSAQFDKTSDTTLASITGLTQNVEAAFGGSARVYKFEAILFTTSNVAGGVKASINGSATATSIVYEGINLDNGVTVNSRTTTLGNTVGASTTVTAAHIVIRGTIVVNGAGTIGPYFAQNASNGAASSVLINSTFCLTPIS